MVGTQVNIGNPQETSIVDFASTIKGLLPDSTSKVVHKAATQDDPRQRKPDISLARDVLSWEPRVPVEDGLRKTIKYFREELDMNGDAPRTVLWQ